MRIKFSQMKIWIASLLPIALFTACMKTEGEPQFELLREKETGLDFRNILNPTAEFNTFTYMYFYNGGGVAAGDFNNDGLVDLFFTSNMGPSKMYLNEGNMKFRDVTAAAGIEGRGGWTSGVSVVDINNDGMLDLYISQVGDYSIIKGQNQLYICKRIENGIPVYADEAIPYGLDLIGFSTQAVFFDYDLDGDLDMFQLNHSVHQNGTFGQRFAFQGTYHPTAGDKLLRNDNGRFVDITEESGINSTVVGYGLGIVVGDVNNDGWPDIYIGNDFHENDYLYINQQNGTFKEVVTEQMQHTSRFSMGVDMADINNDGRIDIISLDMLPSDPFILKSSLGEDDFATFQFKLGYGYNQQFARNNLQLNNGDGTFSEIGMFAGISATDWSWAPLFMDFDNDGYKDIFISNGIPRRMNDIDYVNFRADHEIRFKANTNNLEKQDLAIEEKMPKIKLPNVFFHNSGNLKFEDFSMRIKNAAPSYSNGAIYADLDNDGDLDVVVNNIEDEPFLYKNLTVENNRANNNYISLKLQGSPNNINAIGAKIMVFKQGQQILYENYPVRGYQSSFQINMHIGLGDTTTLDSLLIIWPDNTWQKLEGIPLNTTTTLAWAKGLPQFNYTQFHSKPVYPFRFEDVSGKSGIDFSHVENHFVEFNREFLVPHMVSADGPAVAVGDINGDGLEDLFIGSSKRKLSALYFQQPDGTFLNKTPAAILRDSIFEDVDAVFSDYDNDGDLDLIIAAGGNEYRGEDEPLMQRAYQNDGKGNFERVDIFPGIYMTASCILPADFNGDGLMDYFLGARAKPWNHGVTPRSYLMLNKGNGQFEDVTQKYCPELQNAGMVKNGAWADMDLDGRPDLVLATEWEPVQVFFNRGDRFEKKEVNNMKGWWNFVLPYDFDGDGDMDILAGNLGMNSKFSPSEKQPVRLYVNDFDDNGQIEPILTYYLGGREIPFATYKELTTQLVSLKKKYLFAKDLAKASLTELFGKEKLASSIQREANTFGHMYFENTGNGEFKAHPLPDVLQFSTLQTAALADLNGDGKMELVVGGNFYECNIEMGRYDASYGNVLTIGQHGEMAAFPLGELRINGQVRRIRQITVGGQKYLIFVRNGASPVLVKSTVGKTL